MDQLNAAEVSAMSGGVHKIAAGALQIAAQRWVAETVDGPAPFCSSHAASIQFVLCLLSPANR